MLICFTENLRVFKKKKKKKSPTFESVHLTKIIEVYAEIKGKQKTKKNTQTNAYVGHYDLFLSKWAVLDQNELPCAI